MATGPESATKSTRPHSATLDDVARLAGVSPATVSRCLNRPESVNPEKRQRVLGAVNTLGYVPHGAARALALKQSKMVGGIFPSIDSALFGSALEVFQRNMADAGYTVVVASSAYDPEMEARHIRRLVQSGIDALMVVGLCRDEETYWPIHARGIPYVSVWRHVEDSDHPTIGFDNRAAAEHLTDYLFSLGHRRVAVLSGTLANNDRAQDRLEGVKRSCQRHGVAFDENYLQERPFGVEGGRDMFRSVMSMPEPPTAIVCGSEVFAYGAIFEAAEMKIRIPEQVSIASFDDLWLSAQITPPLTTVRTPHAEIGEQAARYLIARLKGQRIVPPRPLGTDLIIRKSTGPAPT